MATKTPTSSNIVFHSSKFPPNGANRGYFADPRIDALIDQARQELDQNTRKQLYAEIQRTLADELPYINLWYFDNVLVHSKRVEPHAESLRQLRFSENRRTG